MPKPPEALPRWDLAGEAIALKIRWFGVLLGLFYVNVGSPSLDRELLNAILGLGAVYTIVDSWFSYRGRVFLAPYPLVISLLEALFIGLLCYYDTSLESPFRFYFLLSLICCAIRQNNSVTWATCALDCLACGILYAADHPDQEQHSIALVLLLIVMVWATWAASSMASLLKQTSFRLGIVNSELLENQQQLEARIALRTRELQETQAQLMHQDKMAGFGLLAAGIAHEVGNPLTSISSIVQILEKNQPEPYTREKLSLVNGQLTRIQGILRELINFSRPASQERGKVSIPAIIDEALNIIKYYKGTKSRTIELDLPGDLPLLQGVRDQLVQVIFNLLLNAIDATDKGGVIRITAESRPERVEIRVADNGSGIAVGHRERLFQPYFTTKKQGTGLGLFVIRKLVTQHGGTIDFDSSPETGTTFRIELPVVAPQ